MAKYAFRSTIICFFAIFWLLMTLVPIYGGGSKDPDLSKADELIAKREYNEATLVLSDFAKRNPEKFDQAQKRLRKIAQLRDEFNRTAGELIDVLLNEPENSGKIRTLTAKLNSIENESSPLIISLLSRTQEIAQFNLNRNQLRDVLRRGREQLQRNNYTGAIQAYLSGMDIMRDDFFAKGYGANVERDVIREKESVNSTLTYFRQISDPMGTAAAELTRIINTGDLAAINGAIERLMPAMDRFIALKQNIYASMVVFNRHLNEIRRNEPEMGDRNHLAFVSIIINGPSSEDENEGILGVFEVFWKNSVDPCLSALSSNIERLNSASLAAFNEKNYPAAAGYSDRISSYVNLTSQLFQKHMQFSQGGIAQTVQLLGNTVLNKDIRLYLEARALQEANSIITRSANLAANQNIDRSSLTRWQSGIISASEAQRDEQLTRNTINEMQRTLEEIIAEGDRANTVINNYQNVTHISNALNAVGSVRSSLTAEEQQSAIRYYGIARQVIQDNLAERREQLEKGRTLLNGQSRTTESGSTVINRYPSEALTELSAMLTVIEVNIQNGTTTLEQYRNEPRAVTSNSDISNLGSNYQTAINELNNIRTQGLALAETARNQSALAETYRLEGERLFREAQTAFQNRNYESARENIQRASDRFTASLEIQESAALRGTWDVQMVNLGQAIAAAESESIITEVRTLVNNARTLYFDGKFQQAEDNLVRARNRWNIANKENENDEVMYWLDIVRTAMTADTGRVISPTAPLYPEMSQFLSQAQKNFEEGVQYINAGRRTDGIAKFNEAQKLTREVRLIFPVNQEAGLLELRIEQFTDPAAFNASFEQRLRTAVDGTKLRSVESFADLLNLAEINPNYPNIRNIIYQAEIDIGRRQPPPNPANIARSRELTVSAGRILDGNISTQYEVALAQIDQAITLNPDNAEATRIKDRLLNRMSAPGGIVLSREDEEDYQRALREFQAGNNLVAFALVQRLMQNPGNRNITKLIELQRRIQQVLL